MVLTADEIEEAKQILSTKPESIPQDQFDIIKGQILNGTTQVEYLLVWSDLSHALVFSSICYTSSIPSLLARPKKPTLATSLWPLLTRILCLVDLLCVDDPFTFSTKLFNMTGIAHQLNFY